MINKHFYLFVFVLASLGTNLSHSQTKVGVSIDQVAGLIETYTVTYVPPATSAYGTRAFEDTIFCAAIVGTLHGARGIVVPMTRMDSALYVARVVMPDSAYTVRFEICLPTDRLPDGSSAMWMRPDSGNMYPGSALEIIANIDSALMFERRVYPWNFFAYYQYWESSRKSNTRDSLLRIVMSERTPTFNWYMTVSRFHASRRDADSLERIYLDSAVQIQLRDRTHDPLLENKMFWNTMFAPELRGDSVVIQTERFSRTLRLAAAYPRTEVGKSWLLYSLEYSAQDTSMINTLINAWATSNDVSILKSIATQLLMKESLAYDPVRAESFLKRAENSCIHHLGFRTGENIYGSMGRLDPIRASLIGAYAAQGRHEEAIALGKQSMRTAQNGYGRQVLSQAMVSAARASGDTILAATFKNYELPSVPDFDYMTIAGTPGKLSDHSGKVIVIDFWYIGCGGCVIEHKSLNEFGIKYKNESRLVFLTAALNDATTLRKYLARSPLEATVISDAQSICDKLEVTAYPTHVIIDQTGKTVLWQVGGTERTGDNLGKVVTGLLK